MLDHLGLRVADYARSRAFYERALAPLGFAVVMELTAARPFDRARSGWTVSFLMRPGF